VRTWGYHMGENWRFWTCENEHMLGVVGVWKSPFLWRIITYTLHNEIRWFKSLLKCSKMSYNLFSDSIINQASTMTPFYIILMHQVLIHMHVYPSKEWIKHFDSCILTLYLASKFSFKFWNVDLFLHIYTHFYLKKGYMIRGTQIVPIYHFLILYLHPYLMGKHIFLNYILIYIPLLKDFF